MSYRKPNPEDIATDREAAEPGVNPYRPGTSSGKGGIGIHILLPRDILDALDRVIKERNLKSGNFKSPRPTLIREILRAALLPHQGGR